MSKVRLAVYLSVGFFLAGVASFLGALALAIPNSAAAKSITLLEDAIQTADEVEISFLSDPKSHPNAPRYRTKRYPEEYAIVSTRRLTSGQTHDFLGILKKHDFSTSYGSM